MKTIGWRVDVKLVEGGRLLLRSHMQVRKLSNAGLAKLCGDPAYRSSISHLVAGTRDGCSEELAAAITEALLGPGPHKTPLFVPRLSRVTRDGGSPRRVA